MISSLSSVAFLLAAQSQLSLAASCKNFTVSPYGGSEDTYTQPALQTYIVSEGVVCQSGSGSCQVTAGGFITDHRSLNITTDSDTTEAIFDLIISTVSIPFNETLTGNITSTTETINNGTSGYVGFTPTHRCTKGTLSECNGDNDLEGTAIEACTPFSITANGISGSLATVSTSSDKAEALTCNPANTTAAQNGENPSNCSSSNSSSSGGSGQGSDQTGGVGVSKDDGTALFVLCLALAVFGSVF